LRWRATFPRESRLFANEILQGAPHIKKLLESELKPLVDEKANVLSGWMKRAGSTVSIRGI
jgi:TetR/AcrR family transcriptional regulator